MSSPLSPQPFGGKPPTVPPSIRIGGRGGDSEDERAWWERARAWSSHFRRTLWSYVFDNDEAAEATLLVAIDCYPEFMDWVMDQHGAPLLLQISLDCQDIAFLLQGDEVPEEAKGLLEKNEARLDRLHKLTGLIQSGISGEEPPEVPFPFAFEDSRPADRE